MRVLEGTDDVLNDGSPVPGLQGRLRHPAEDGHAPEGEERGDEEIRLCGVRRRFVRYGTPPIVNPSGDEREDDSDYLHDELPLAEEPAARVLGHDPGDPRYPNELRDLSGRVHDNESEKQAPHEVTGGEPQRHPREDANRRAGDDGRNDGAGPERLSRSESAEERIDGQLEERARDADAGEETDLESIRPEHQGERGEERAARDAVLAGGEDAFRDEEFLRPFLVDARRDGFYGGFYHSSGDRRSRVGRGDGVAAGDTSID